ncbi:MAG TPA: alpha/beta hydrolase [Noviherbaspirillum sp.]|nr:alpha/beta hydrolase [Noviherbaspirillum sp.]
MKRITIHFSHANSYPAGTYTVLFEQMKKHYDVHALDMHAHNPAYPVTNGWSWLERELADELHKRYREPVVLVGHSLGGMLSLMAAKARPELVRAVVLLDSPVVAGWRAAIWGAIKPLKLADRFSPARLSERRRNVWPDAEAAWRHFASKDVFARWDRRVLRDYLKHGLVPHPEGVTLRFSRETETAIYRSLPHHLGKLASRSYPVPVGFIGGHDSVECRQAGLAATRRLVGRHFMQVPGGHLFPMEAPAETAKAVHKMIHSLLNKP